MIYRFLEIIATYIMALISSLGLPGIVILMAIESACIPLPSEVIMPLSGFLASQGRFSLIAVALAGTAGNLIGSIPAYYLGQYGGRPLIEKYGRYLLITRKDLDTADRWFNKYGEATIFFARLLPVVRTFIAFPAGVSKMNIMKFSVYTLLGSFPWCFGLAYIGYTLGEHWSVVKGYFHKFDLVIGGLLLVGIVYFIYHHLKTQKT